MAADPGQGEYGVYVHVPFCGRRCDYCAFATWTDREHLADRYVDACVAEVVARVASGEVRPATSVFLGGGTPSRLSPAQVGRLLDAVPRAAGAEVTLECNPEDAAVERLAGYRAAGVTRLSFGVQSVHPHVLAALGRAHVPGAAARVSEAAVAAGFETWNLDLIFGSPAESDDDWAATLDAVLSLAHPPPHLSAYALTVEPGTALAADAARHPDDDVQAGRYELAESRLSAAGYAWEEVSNWARPGHGCRHNALYWRQGDYAGIGCAAHSHAAGRRWWNVRTPERYLAAVSAGAGVVAGEEVLTPAQRSFEALALSLRTPAGVPAWALPDDEVLAPLVRRSAGRAVLTVAGRLLANAVTAALDPEGGRDPAGTLAPHDGGGTQGSGADGQGGQPVQAPGDHLRLGRDLRRVPLDL